MCYRFSFICKFMELKKVTAGLSYGNLFLHQEYWNYENGVGIFGVLTLKMTPRSKKIKNVKKKRKILKKNWKFLRKKSKDSTPWKRELFRQLKIFWRGKAWIQHLPRYSIKPQRSTWQEEFVRYTHTTPISLLPITQ